MAIDLGKYGRFTTEKGTIGENEPCCVFRAQDKLLPKILAYYHLFCLKEGSPREHTDMILDVREQIIEWQKNNKTKVPD